MRQLTRALTTRVAQVPLRSLNIHECYGKDLMAKYGIDIQRGRLATEASQVAGVCDELVREYKTTNFICKSQILAGGRGKGTFDDGFKGGVKFCKTKEDAVTNAGRMLGKKLTTIQTPPGGILVQKVFITECLDIKRELYVAMVLDRASRGPVLVGCTEGGVEIEEVAHNTPEKIVKLPLRLVTNKAAKCGFVLEPASPTGITDFVKGLAFEGDGIARAEQLVRRLLELGPSLDVLQLEINPLSETECGRLCAIDAKFNIDDSAQFRQAEAFSYRDTDEEDPREVEASKWDLNYVAMSGTIGCMVNGAGLAMATMDIIKQKGKDPANFLDVGGTATADRVAAAFKIITSDPSVKGILVNIFGGIVNCEMIADGVIQAIKQIGLRVPVVVRLSGTNAEAGLAKLAASGLDLHAATDMDSAATKIVSLV